MKIQKKQKVVKSQTQIKGSKKCTLEIKFKSIMMLNLLKRNQCTKQVFNDMRTILFFTSTQKVFF